MKTLTKDEVDFLLNIIESEEIKLHSVKDVTKNKKIIEEPLAMITEIKKKINTSYASCL